MNEKSLSSAIREYARAVSDDGCGKPSTAKVNENDTAELLRCLARMIEGKTAEQAFGAPGDWGYGTPIGEALR